MYAGRNFYYTDLFLGLIFTYQENNIFRKKYNSVTTFDDLQNTFLFNPFFFYPGIECVQGFCFNINFNWKRPRESRVLPLRTQRNFWIQNTKLSVDFKSSLVINQASNRNHFPWLRCLLSVLTIKFSATLQLDPTSVLSRTPKTSRSSMSLVWNQPAPWPAS